MAFFYAPLNWLALELEFRLTTESDSVEITVTASVCGCPAIKYFPSGVNIRWCATEGKLISRCWRASVVETTVSLGTHRLATKIWSPSSDDSIRGDDRDVPGTPLFWEMDPVQVAPWLPASSISKMITNVRYRQKTKKRFNFISCLNEQFRKRLNK